MRELNDPDIYRDYTINRIVLLSADNPITHEGIDISILPLGDGAMSRLTHVWVDEVFILQPDYLPFPIKLHDELMLTGITTNNTVTAISDNHWPVTDIRKLENIK